MKATINFGENFSTAVLETTATNGDYELGGGVDRNNDDNGDEEEELSGCCDNVSECVSNVNQIIQTTTSEINNRIIDAADDSTASIRIVVDNNESESITFIQALETTRPSRGGAPAVKSSPVRHSAAGGPNSALEVNQKKKKQICQSNSTFYIPVTEGSSSSAPNPMDESNN